MTVAVMDSGGNGGMAYEVALFLASWAQKERARQNVGTAEKSPCCSYRYESSLFVSGDLFFFSFSM